MKVYFDSVIFQLQKRGGASNYWMELFDRFFAENECSLFMNSESRYLNKDFMQFIKNKKINVLQDKNISGSLSRVINPPKITNSDDKVIFHSTVYRWNKGKNIKNVITIHDFTHQKYMTGYHKLLNSWLKKRSIKRADGIVCISSSTYNDLICFYPKAINKKIAIIYNGFNSKVFRKIDNPVLEDKYKILRNKKFVLFVGQRSGYKNFNFMLEVLKKVEDINLVVVGGGQLDYKSMPVDLSDRIFYFTNVSDVELNILYNNSFCFIYPSLYEGFGIPICESMNSGCPVIAFNNSSIPEVMNGAGILVENNDIDGVALELDKLNDETYRKKIVSQQYEACKKFSWDRAYKEMFEFYHKVLKK